MNKLMTLTLAALLLLPATAFGAYAGEVKRTAEFGGTFMLHLADGTTQTVKASDYSRVELYEGANSLPEAVMLANIGDDGMDWVHINLLTVTHTRLEAKGPKDARTYTMHLYY